MINALRVLKRERTSWVNNVRKMLHDTILIVLE